MRWKPVAGGALQWWTGSWTGWNGKYDESKLGSSNDAAFQVPKHTTSCVGARSNSGWDTGYWISVTDVGGFTEQHIAYYSYGW